MLSTDGLRSRPTLSPRHARRGAVLVLVIFFVFLAGTLAALATSYSLQLAQTTRHHHESIVLRQMADSAYGWLVAQANWRAVVPAVLDTTGLVPEGTSGTVRIRSHETQPGVVVIEAKLTSAHCQRCRTTGLKVPP